MTKEKYEKTDLDSLTGFWTTKTGMVILVLLFPLLRAIEWSIELKDMIVDGDDYLPPARR